MKNVFVLVNPASANGSTARVWPDIAAELKKQGVEFKEYHTTGPYQAPEAVRQALKNGAQTIVSVGGDGTANEVVNGFFENNKPINPNARLAVISRGTGCDLIRTLGIPKDYEGAVETITNNREKVIDLGMLEYTTTDGKTGSRYFVNIADVGMGGMAASRVNHTSKSAGGFLSFLYGTVWSIIIYKNGHARVVADGQEVYNDMVTMVAVANGRYFGGGMELSPHGLIDDGKLDLVLLKGMGKLTLFANLARIYKGTHLSHPKVSTRPVSRVELEFPPERVLPVELDGETPDVISVAFSVQPGALRVLC